MDGVRVLAFERGWLLEKPGTGEEAVGWRPEVWSAVVDGKHRLAFQRYLSSHSIGLVTYPDPDIRGPTLNRLEDRIERQTNDVVYRRKVG